VLADLWVNSGLFPEEPLDALALTGEELLLADPETEPLAPELPLLPPFVLEYMASPSLFISGRE